MNIARMKLAGIFLGLVAFGGVLGALFSGYGGFANAATPGYSNTQAAVSTGATAQGDTKDANGKGNAGETVNKEDLLHYADLFEQNVASQLGVDKAQLEAALKSAFQSTVDQAVADGKLDATSASAIKTKLGDLNFKGMLSMPFGMPSADKIKDALGNGQAFMDATGKAFDAAAQLLGMSREEFEKSLRDGNLSTVLASRNVTVETLLNTLTSTLRTELDRAVTAGTLTQEQADLVYNAFKGKIGAVLTGAPESK